MHWMASWSGYGYGPVSLSWMECMTTVYTRVHLKVCHSLVVQTQGSAGGWMIVRTKGPVCLGFCLEFALWTSRLGPLFAAFFCLSPLAPGFQIAASARGVLLLLVLVDYSSAVRKKAKNGSVAATACFKTPCLPEFNHFWWPRCRPDWAMEGWRSGRCLVPRASCRLVWCCFGRQGGRLMMVVVESDIVLDFNCTMHDAVRKSHTTTAMHAARSLLVLFCFLRRHRQRRRCIARFPKQAAVGGAGPLNNPFSLPVAGLVAPRPLLLSLLIAASPCSLLLCRCCRAMLLSSCIVLTTSTAIIAIISSVFCRTGLVAATSL